MQEEERQAIVDGEHLRILSICYYVSAGTTAVFSLFGLFYGFMGLFFMSAADRLQAPPGQSPPPQFVGLLFGLFGFGLFTTLVAVAILKFIVARRLKEHRARTFCMIVAGVSCLGIPFGTILGVFTFVVLLRPSVMQLFEANDSGEKAIVV
jgi:hypothetical protein